MRRARLAWLAARLTLFVLPVLGAQSPAEPSHAPSGGTRTMLASISIPPIPDAPFTATVTTQWIRRLENGGALTLQNRRTIARDNSGRVFQERRYLSPVGDTSPLTRLEFADPQSHTIYFCWPQAHLCRERNYFGSAKLPALIPTGPSDGGKVFLTRIGLGTDRIDGLDVIGTTETTTVFAGAIGNDGPLEIVKEFWFSPQLGINLIEKRQDPRFGTENFQVSELSLGEPDSALFDLPSGFRVIDLRKPNSGARGSSTVN